MNHTANYTEELTGTRRYFDADHQAAYEAGLEHGTQQALAAEREKVRGLVAALEGVTAIIRINTKSEHIHPIYAEDTRYKHAVKLLKTFRAKFGEV